MNALVDDIDKVLMLLEYQAALYLDGSLPVTQEVLNKFSLTESDFRVAFGRVLQTDSTIKVSYEHIEGDMPTGDNYEVELFKIVIPTDFNKDAVRNKFIESLPENQTFSGSLRPTNNVGLLEEYSDGTIRVKGETIRLRNALKDICRLFITRNPQALTSDDIRDRVFGGKALSHETIVKYISELRKALQPHFKKKVLVSQSKEGWMLNIDS